MRGSLPALCFVALSFAWLALFGAGIRQTDWNAALLFLGATALFYWTFRAGQTPPRLPVWHAAALWLLPCYALLQLVPLPFSLLQSLSPARALIATSLEGVVPDASRAPISVAPGAAQAGLFSLLGALTVFSLVRDIKWRLAEDRSWLAAGPLVLIASIEAVIGIGQWLTSPPNTPLRGTLSTSEYLAELLEIALPFTLIYGYISFRRYQAESTSATIPAASAALSWLSSLLILLALFHSSSQCSNVVVFASLVVIASLALIPRLRTKPMRWYAACASATLVLVALLIVAPPNQFVESAAQLGASAKSSPDNRIAIWSSAASLLGDFRWVGTGMGGFESIFPKYQGFTDLSRIQTPHSDLLALLITWGICGACIAAVALAGILRPAVMGALFLEDERRRLFAVSVTASITGLLVRSGLESTLSAPVMAMAFAWLAGLSQSCGLD